MEQVVGGWRKGPWTPQEDKLLIHYITHNGEGRWSSVSKCTGLRRSGKSCRLRWVNYLRPGLKKGHLTPQEEGIIIELHALWGNKWSTIARYLPGRTDNEIKNYWRTHFKTRKQQNIFKHVQKQESETDFNASSESPAETEKDDEIVMKNNHQFMPSVYQESDFVTMDCYNLWDGLWNLNDDDDLGNVCNQMAVDPNQPINVANYYHPFQDDAVDYVQPRSGDCLLYEK